MPTQAEQFAADVKAVQELIVGIVAAEVPAARLHRRFIFDENEDKYAGLLTSPNDLDIEGKRLINAVQIFPDGMGWDPVTAVRTVKPKVPFIVAFFREYNLGTDANNSQDKLWADIYKATWALAVSTDLGNRTLVLDHTNLDIPRLSFLPLGRRAAFRGVGRLTVNMNVRFLSGP